jgi:hypothetical protein
MRLTAGAEGEPLGVAKRWLSRYGAALRVQQEKSSVCAHVIGSVSDAELPLDFLRLMLSEPSASPHGEFST